MKEIVKKIPEPEANEVSETYKISCDDPSTAEKTTRYFFHVKNESGKVIALALTPEAFFEATEAAAYFKGQT